MIQWDHTGNLFYYFFEVALLSYVGLNIFGFQPLLIKLGYLTIIQGFIVYLVRSIYITYDIPLGSHVIILIVTSALLMTLLLKIKLIRAFGATIIAFVMLMFGEIIYYPVATKLLDIEIFEAIQQPLGKWYFGFGSCFVLLSFAIYYSVKTFRK